MFPQNCTASSVCVTFNISKKQFFQVALFTLCLQENWTVLDTLLTTKLSYLHPGCT